MSAVLTAIWETKVFLIFLCVGLYRFLNGLFPPDPEEDPEFYHWKETESEGVSVTILGFQFGNRREKVIREGMRSPATARMIALISGAVFILIAVFGILHYLHLPPFAPNDTTDF